MLTFLKVCNDLVAFYLKFLFHYSDVFIRCFDLRWRSHVQSVSLHKELHRQQIPCSFKSSSFLIPLQNSRTLIFFFSFSTALLFRTMWKFWHFASLYKSNVSLKFTINLWLLRTAYSCLRGFLDWFVKNEQGLIVHCLFWKVAVPLLT